MNHGDTCQATPLQLALVEKIIRLHPDTSPFLVFETPFQLLIAVILSAQCTDAQVNVVTQVLFRAFPDAPSLARASLPVVEKIVYSTGFYREKAKNIVASARALVDRFDAEVPLEMDDLLTLPGVGRKTANVIRGQIAGLPAVIVDTHFKRVVRRLGFTEEQDPVKIENVLNRMIPARLQYAFSMAANRHGRKLCRARDPLCAECPVQKLCPSG